jgi:formamidopyrimidine-DNA glycosylase
MPELPDLEVLRENLAPRVIGRTVRGAEVLYPRFWHTPEREPRGLVGEEAVGIDRRGKFLIFFFSSGSLVFHLMRWAWIWHGAGSYAPTRATLFRLSLDDGTDLRIIEPKVPKLASAWLVEDAAVAEPLEKLGVEPLSEEFTLEVFRGLLSGKRRQLRRLFIDQSLIAGIGNAYADEILFAARLSPFRYTHTLTEGEVEGLWRAIPDTLRWAIREIKGRVGEGLFEQEVRDFLRVHGRAGQPCLVCGTPIGEVLLAGGRTDFCPACQGVNQPIPR